MIKIFDSLKKKYTYIKTKNINIYICGITVYDECHIGHARILFFFDTLIRYLKFNDFEINFVRNITDVDDKIIKKAIDKKTSIENITKKFIKSMQDDIKNLNLIEPTFEPKATTFIKKMIKNIEIINKKGYAYKNVDNDICYNTAKNKKYGKFIKKEYIKNNFNFTLWKINKKNIKYSWLSPWGNGIPGWHTECFTMSTYYFKNGLDIHGGGIDLAFPHHENEIAQYEIIKKKKLSRIWMHVGFLNINDQKMSKSINNTIKIKNILKEINEEYLRFFFISSHYKTEINYSKNSIEKAINALNYLYKTIIEFEIEINSKYKNINSRYKKFRNAINKDINTPEALSVLFNIAKKINKTKDISYDKSKILARDLKILGNSIGILKYDPKIFLNINNENIKNINYIKNLIEKRNIARKSKNWYIADKIRNKLNDLNVVLEDNKNKTIFIIKKNN